MSSTIITTKARAAEPIVTALAPVFILPIGCLVLFRQSPPWELMWLLAISTYLGFKWMTFASCDLERRPTFAHSLGYLLLWPGMNAKTFLESSMRVAKPSIGEWMLATAKLAFGVTLSFVGVPNLGELHPLVAGWIGMIGLVFIFHFGIFHILSLCWRANGINAEPIMNYPILASSLGDFWGRRWNMAFRDLAFGYILRPLVRQIGVVRATMLVFLFSGLIHDLVISVPARDGWGGPTIYFIFQGAGLLLERSTLGKKLGLGNGITGRFYCGLITVGPVGFLFHEPFVRQIILPTLAAIRTIGI